MIEQLTDRSYQWAMQRWLFEPLGMHSAGFGQPDAVRGHQRLFGKAVPTKRNNAMQQLPIYYAPAGDVQLSLADWAKFVYACLGGDLLAPATRRAMFEPVHGSEYACGFVVRRRSDGAPRPPIRGGARSYASIARPVARCS